MYIRSQYYVIRYHVIGYYVFLWILYDGVVYLRGFSNRRIVSMSDESGPRRNIADEKNCEKTSSDRIQKLLRKKNGVDFRKYNVISIKNTTMFAALYVGGV